MPDQTPDTASVARPKECYEDTHVWSDDYVDGDTCNCGALYLLNTTPPRVVMASLPEEEK